MPATPCSANLLRQSPTVCRETPSSSAMSQFLQPSAADNTMFDRSLNLKGVRRPRDQPLSTFNSALSSCIARALRIAHAVMNHLDFQHFLQGFGDLGDRETRSRCPPPDFLERIRNCVDNTNQECYLSLMPNYRRNLLPGGTFFFTVVTEGRQPILSEPGIMLLRRIVRQCLDSFPFTINAMVVLPDHLHSIWTLPEGDSGYSKRWGNIKKEFTKEWLSSGHVEQPISQARQRERRRGVWVPRFWEHTIRDGHDFKRHMDYIHYNPVKHGYVRCPHAWRPSSFHRSVRRGVYEPRWGCACRASECARPRIMSFDDIEATVGEDCRKWIQRDFGRG